MGKSLLSSWVQLGHLYNRNNNVLKGGDCTNWSFGPIEHRALCLSLLREEKMMQGREEVKEEGKSLFFSCIFQYCPVPGLSSLAVFNALFMWL